MANMDTATKRFSAIGVSLPWRPPMSMPGTDGAAARLFLALRYAGIAASDFVAVVRNILVLRWRVNT